jgi:hypothetical protein
MKFDDTFWVYLEGHEGDEGPPFRAVGKFILVRWQTMLLTLYNRLPAPG